MANIHIKEAANNMRKAVSDVRQLMQQTQADAVRTQRELEQHIHDLESRKNVLQQQMRRSEGVGDAEIAVMSQRIDDEIRELSQQITTLKADSARQSQELDKQAYDFDSLANRLDMMA
jgi:uncharacterized phage infection (PIP) family protein YhgE